MINKIDNTSFQCRFRFHKYSTHTPKFRPYREFEFMPELQNKNPLKEFINSIKKVYQQYLAQKP